MPRLFSSAGSPASFGSFLARRTLIAACAFGAAPLFGAVTLSMDFATSDPTGTYSQYYAGVTTDFNAAVQAWVADLATTGNANLNVTVVFSTTTTAIATCGGSSYYTGQTYQGNTVYSFSPLQEIQTGTNTNGTSTDLTLTINANMLANGSLYLNPSPGVDPLPSGTSDAISVFTHEFGHALGINGFRDANGNLAGAYMSLFDKFVVVENSLPYFTGKYAQLAYGGEVPLASGNLYHFGNPGGDGAQLAAEGELMYPSIGADTIRTVTDLDLAAFRDMGIALATANPDYFLKGGVISASYPGIITAVLDGTHSLTKTTGGTATLSAANTYSGGTTVTGGTLIITNASGLGTGAVLVNGGTLDVNTTAVGGIGALTLDSGNITGTTGTLTATSYAVRSGTVSAILAGSGALTKTTTGTVTLSGANTYSGATTVSAGTLVMAGGAIASNTVVVSSGAAFGGFGTVGTSGASLTLASGATLLGDVSGTLTLNGSISAGTGTHLDFASLPAAGNTYTILNYTGSASGLSNLSTQFRGSVDTSVAGTVKVTVLASVPLTWKGAADDGWGANDAKPNFVRTASPSTSDNFFQGDAVVFDDTATTKTVTLTGRLLASSVTVSDTTGTYAFGGTGLLSGTMGLTKSGAGTLLIGTANDYTGKTALNGGVTQISADNAFGAAPASASAVADQLSFGGGTLQLAAATTLATGRGITVNAGGGTFDTNGFDSSYGGVLAGAGVFTKAGAGTLELAGAETITGNVLVSAGKLTLSNLSGTGLTALEVGASATLLLNDTSANNSVVHNIVVHGAGVSATTGLHIAAGENFSIAYNSTITLTDAPTTIRAEGSGTAILSTRQTGFSNLTVAASASGSVIDSSVQFAGNPDFYSNDFGLTINTTAGANTATGDLRVDGALRQGTGGTSALDIRGTGSVNLTATSDAWTQGSFTIRNTATLMLTGSASLGAGTDSGTIQFVNTGGKFVWNSSAAQSLTGVISGTGAVNANAGRLTLGGTNTYASGTTVTGGRLVTANTSALGTGAVAVSSGAVLQIGDGVTNGVTLGSGASLAFASGSTFALGAAASNIAMAGAGKFTFSNTVNIDITGLSLTAGAYTLVTGATTGNEVGSWSSANLIGGNLSAYSYGFALSGNNAVLTVTAVPEPAAWSCAGAASLAAVVAVRRRKRIRRADTPQ